MLSSLGVAPVSGMFSLNCCINKEKKLLIFFIVVDVLSSLTISPNKSELYSSASTPDSSAKGSLPQTPSTW